MSMTYKDRKESFDKYLDNITKNPQERKNLLKVWLSSGFPEVKIDNSLDRDDPSYNIDTHTVIMPKPTSAEQAKVNLFEELAHSKQTRSLQSPFMPSFNQSPISGKEANLATTVLLLALGAIGKTSLLGRLKAMTALKGGQKIADVLIGKPGVRENLINKIFERDYQESSKYGKFKSGEKVGVHDIPGTYEYMTHSDINPIGILDNKIYSQPTTGEYSHSQKYSATLKDLDNKGISGMIYNQYKILANPNANKNLITKAIANIKFLLKDSSNQMKITKQIKKRLDKEYPKKTAIEKLKEFKKVLKASNQ